MFVKLTFFYKSRKSANLKMQFSNLQQLLDNLADFKMMKNAYLLANIGTDTAENEQKLPKS